MINNQDESVPKSGGGTTFIVFSLKPASGRSVPVIRWQTSKMGKPLRRPAANTLGFLCPHALGPRSGRASLLPAALSHLR